MKIDFKTASWKNKIERWKFKFKSWDNRKLNLKLQQRFQELEASKNLLDIYKLTHLRLHKLSWKRMYELAVDINWKICPNRIVFECLDGEDIHSDWPNENKMTTVTYIKIVEIWDYH